MDKLRKEKRILKESALSAEKCRIRKEQKKQDRIQICFISGGNVAEKSL